MSNAIKFVFAATMAASSACAVMAQDAQDFRVTDIVAIDVDTTPGQPPFLFIPDPDSDGAIGLNNNNQICYTRKVDGVLTAFIWLPEAAYGLSAGLHTLSPPSGITGDCIARDLTDNGIIVGQAGGIEPGDDAAVACYWDLNNSTTAVSLGQLEEDR